MSDQPGDDALTVDELARRAGTLTSTVRMYQAKGLLPAPTKQGRIAVYTAAHLARLRLIGELQERGFSLQGIKELLDGWEAGASLPDLLGLRRWQGGRPLRLTPAELAERLAGAELTVDVMQRAIRLGLVTIDGTDVLVPDQRFLAVGAELVRLGVPVDDVLEEYEQLQRDAAAIAQRFTSVFERHLWPTLQRSSPDALVAALDALAPLAHAVVDAALQASLRQAADGFASAHADELAAAPAKPVSRRRGSDRAQPGATGRRRRS